MDFVFNEDQEALASSVKRFLMTEMTPELIRELWTTPTGRSERMWDMFASQGLTAVSVPENFDGLGLGGVSVGTRMSCCRNAVSSSKWASIQLSSRA